MNRYVLPRSKLVLPLWMLLPLVTGCEPTYLPNPSLVDSTEITDFHTNENEGPVNSGNMFTRRISGHFKLKNPGTYEKIEVLITLYDKDGIFLTEYAASRENIVRTEDQLRFEIEVQEPYGMFGVADYGYLIQGQ